jgi:predicted Zn-dependent peptidase
MTVQADMLFNPTFPEHELPKERKVVIEEINRSMDATGAAAEEFFVQEAYAGTAYARPVLGYKAFIENTPREAIITYWKKYYTPDNMIMLVIGDFETVEMKATIEGVFGRFEPAARPRVHELSGGDPLTGQHRRDTVADVSSTYIKFDQGTSRVESGLRVVRPAYQLPDSGKNLSTQDCATERCTSVGNGGFCCTCHDGGVLPT